MAIFTPSEASRIQYVIDYLEAGSAGKMLDETAADVLTSVFQNSCSFNPGNLGSFYTALKESPISTLLRAMLCASPVPPPLVPVVPLVSAGFAVAIDWSERVVANGGPAPSANTIAAFAAFYTGILTNGLDSKIFTLNCFAPDSLTACFTPLIHSVGSDPWINHGFVPGDLSVNGLQGDGVSKYVDTTVIANLTATNENDFGFTLYATTLNDGDHVEFGSYDAALTTFIGSRLRSSANTPGCFGNVCDNSIAARAGAAFPGQGYFSFNRVSPIDFRAYFANLSNPHAQLGATVTQANDRLRPLSPFLCFAYSASGVPTSLSDATLGFTAIHRGLTSAESANLYLLVQAVRVFLGDGFV